MEMEELASISDAEPPVATRIVFSRIAPAAMPFVPCRNGYSHRPDENASPEDIERGTLILAEILAALAV